jgi:hypothetical protein
MQKLRWRSRVGQDVKIVGKKNSISGALNKESWQKLLQ